MSANPLKPDFSSAIRQCRPPRRARAIRTHTIRPRLALHTPTPVPSRCASTKPPPHPPRPTLPHRSAPSTSSPATPTPPAKPSWLSRAADKLQRSVTAQLPGSMRAFPKASGTTGAEDRGVGSVGVQAGRGARLAQGIQAGRSTAGSRVQSGRSMQASKGIELGRSTAGRRIQPGESTVGRGIQPGESKVGRGIQPGESKVGRAIQPGRSTGRPNAEPPYTNPNPMSLRLLGGTQGRFSWRAVAMTLATAVIAVVGSVYGAQLKTRQQIRERDALVREREEVDREIEERVRAEQEGSGAAAAPESATKAVSAAQELAAEELEAQRAETVRAARGKLERHRAELLRKLDEVEGRIGRRRDAGEGAEGAKGEGAEGAKGEGESEGEGESGGRKSKGKSKSGGLGDATGYFGEGEYGRGLK